MKCERCAFPVQGATWYCPNCGAPVKDLNVADSVAGRRLPPLVRFSLFVSLASLTLMGLAALALGAGQRLRGQDPRAVPGIVVRPSERATDIAASRAATAERQPAGDPQPAVSSGGSEGAEGTAPPDADAGGSPNAAPRIREGAPVLRFPRAAVPPRIDGALDDWERAPLSVEPFELSAVVFGEEHWEGRQDLSAQLYGAWSPAALYLGLRVYDDIVSQPSTGETLYLGDSIELQLDTEPEADWDDDAYSDDDWQLGISPGDLLAAEGVSEAYIWRPVDQRGAAELPVRARRLDDGYIIEVALPWSLVGVDPETRQTIGLAVNISDNDRPEPEQLTMISSSPIRLWGDPRSFGTLVLER